MGDWSAHRRDLDWCGGAARPRWSAQPAPARRHEGPDDEGRAAVGQLAVEGFAEAISPSQPLYQPRLERLAPAERARVADPARLSWELWRTACRMWG